MVNVLSLVLIGLYLWSSLPQQFRGIDNSLVRRLAAWNYPVLFQQEYPRLFYAGFLHAYPAHLILNLIALNVLGERVERGAGALVLLVVFLSASVTGFVAHIVLSHTPAIGASGGITGLMGICLWWSLTPNLSQPLRFFVRRWRWNLIFWAGLTLAWGYVYPDVSQGAHAGGFFLGLLAGGVFQMLGLHPDLAMAFVPPHLLRPREPLGVADANQRPMPRY